MVKIANLCSKWLGLGLLVTAMAAPLTAQARDNVVPYGYVYAGDRHHHRHHGHHDHPRYSWRHHHAPRGYGHGYRYNARHCPPPRQRHHSRSDYYYRDRDRGHWDFAFRYRD